VTYLEVDQLNPDKTVCQMHQAYTEQHPNGETFDISNSTHHQPLYFHVIAPVSQTCGGSRQFRMDLHVQWKGGNPIKSEGGNVNVINSVRATTTTVPRVTGDTEAQADAALQAAGLTASPVGVMSPATPGTVVDQNAPFGTVEPTGSPVQIMVSQGQTTVPPVLSDTLSKATTAIRNAGLSVGSVTYLNNCVDPGTVQSQDPSPGAQASLGSPVNIQLSTCTSPTQQPK
jgi:beta-lactam-binding protein with PASTA domain